MILKSALALVGAGLVAGAPWPVDRARRCRHDRQPARGRGLPIVIAALAMIAVGLVAAYVPARRAARVNPVDALRRGESCPRGFPIGLPYTPARPHTRGETAEQRAGSTAVVHRRCRPAATLPPSLGALS